MSKQADAAAESTEETALADLRARLTPERAGRLYRLLKTIDHGAVPRASLLQRLEVGLRTFYRDLDVLRTCGIPIEAIGNGYTLPGGLANALHRLPFPNPSLTFADVMVLMRGRSKVHLRLAEMYRQIADN